MSIVPAALLASAAVAARLLDPVPAPEDVTPGWGALVLFASLFVVTTLLWLSMRKQLGKIRFEEEPDTPPDQPASPEHPAAPDEPSPEERREDGAGPA